MNQDQARRWAEEVELPDSKHYWVECMDCGTWKRVERGNHHPWCGCTSDRFRWGNERHTHPDDDALEPVGIVSRPKSGSSPNVVWRDWLPQEDGALLFTVDQVREAIAAALVKLTQGQEPVMIYRGRHTLDCGEFGSHDMEMLKLIPAGTKLYTHPAPSQQEDRKPLSKEQLIDAYCVAPGIFQFVQAFIAGARFAEKHHNIQEQQ